MGPPVGQKGDTGDSATPGSVGKPEMSDLLVQYGLTGVLDDMRKRKMRSTFVNFIADLPKDVFPFKPRCKVGSLREIALMPVNEDVRRLALFDERVLRNALTLTESPEKPALPDWLDEEQEITAEEKRKKKDKRRKKKKQKRKDGKGDGLDDEERRLRKRRKKSDRC